MPAISCNPQDLLKAASGFQGMTVEQLLAVGDYLLCQLAEGVTTYPPAANARRSTILDSVSSGNYSFTNLAQLISVSFPNVTNIGPVALALGVNQCPLATTFDFPALTTIGVLQFTWSNSFAAAVTIQLPKLQSAGANGTIAFFAGSPTSVTLVIPDGAPLVLSSLTASPVAAIIPPATWKPANGVRVVATGLALNAATVNALLARCVANPAYVSGTVDLSGGTSAAPSGEGVNDKATLIARGVNVTTN